MYIITQDGEKLQVDTSSVDYENGWHPWYQAVAAVDDDTTYLKDVWIVSLQKCSDSKKFWNFETEFVKEAYFDHEPSKEEIMSVIIMAGQNAWDTIAFVDHGYMMDREYDD